MNDQRSLEYRIGHVFGESGNGDGEITKIYQVMLRCYSPSQAAEFWRGHDAGTKWFYRDAQRRIDATLDRATDPKERAKQALAAVMKRAGATILPR